ncbi:PnuC ribosyl nicotinamide transporter [Vibrio phage nt-1]|uniref:PnuC ribosyl nicotinamide transporter n=1 Tax=Vibrio phage nt-1 TaxID=115992 RepID=R9TJK1_9CAUD|nr:PnuC-like nicotinamide mononucleotide transport [Vibrio phage nt-1]AGN30277.1 PnuC ribosyl nicotinamide transporter [Vibrio phage nt-1]
MFDLLFNINHTVFSIGDYAVSGLELWATITGLVCVIMARMNMKHNFTVGIVNCIGFAILFFQIQLYSDVLLQGFFIAASAYGFYQWNKKDDDEVLIQYMTPLSTFLAISLTAIATYALTHSIDTIMWISGNILVDNYEHIPAALSGLDAFTTCASIMAFMLMIQRKVEAWLFWVAVNVVCIYNYSAQGVIVVAVEYCIFLMNAMLAVLTWHREASQNKLMLELKEQW